MAYDPTEMFRVDPGEMELTDEFQAQMELERQAEEARAAQAAMAESGETTPTGGQPGQTQPAAPTGQQQQEQQFPWQEGFDLGDAARQIVQGGLSVPAGIVDFGVDVVNKISGQKFRKLPEFETEHLQALREIASVVAPTIMLGGVGRAAGIAANARVGWSAGNLPVVRFMGERGIEALAGVTVGAVSSEYEEDNITGTLKKSFPKTFDFIPDTMATLPEDDTDTKRMKNIYEDLGLGFVTDLAAGAVKFVGAVTSAAGALRRSNQLVGETAEARRWLGENSPPPKSADPEEAVIRSSIKQEEALDEVGYYNLSENPNMDVALKGVHDVFDYGELGVRTVDDFGVVGAAIDQARIAKNLDTVYGRIGNMISEPALKYALKSGENAQDIVLGLADQLRQAGRIGMEGNGWKVTFDDVLDTNEDLAIQLFDPRMSKADIRQVLEPFITRTDDGKEVMAEGGFAMASRALRGFGQELSSMDVARAQALLAGSLSGRISDLSEGARLMVGTESVDVAKEKIIDLMQYTTQLAGSAKYYKNRKANLIQLIQNGFRNIEGYNQATVEGAGDVAQKIFADSQRFASTMRQISENQPDLMDQFLMAYELTDGNVDTINKMNKYIHGMTLDLGKAIVNLNPEVENKLISGVWSNVFNSILSAFKTPIEALVGNFGGIISQPISHFAGAVMSGDLQAIQRGWVAYSSVGETLQRALPYAGSIFMKASKEPNSVRAGTRIDLLLSKEQEMEFLKTAARTQAAQGNHGLQYLVNQIEMLNDLGQDPILRFGPNAMTALDGFTGVFNASAEARFRAMDELITAGKPITKENVKPIADKYYSKMFGPDDMLTDEAVKYATSEMALNLDTPIAQAVSDFVQRVPGTRPFLMFPTTGMNLIDIGGKYNPFWTPFQRDVNELAYTKLSDLLGNEERIDELLRARNIDISNLDTIAKQNKIADLKYITRGRKAIGGLAVTSAIGLAFQDRLRGDGLYDKEAQRAREKQTNWKARTIKGVDGKWYSYDALGPLADWIAFVANVADNFDMLGEAATEKYFEKASFVLAASVTDRTGLSTMRPLLDILSGNEGALTRWAAGFTNSLGPLAGQRAEWSRIFSEGLRELDNDFLSYIDNRNSFAGELDPANRQPYVYSPLTGEKANGYGLLQRVWNAYSPIKIHSEQSPEEKFLEAAEFDVNTTFKTKDGVKLTASERSELFRLMGTSGHFKASIQEIMRDAGNWNSLPKLAELRRRGVKSEDVSLKKWHDIHVRLSEARRAAEDFAYAEMDADMAAALELRQVEKQLSEEAAVMGQTFESTTSIRK